MGTPEDREKCRENSTDIQPVARGCCSPELCRFVEVGPCWPRLQTKISLQYKYRALKERTNDSAIDLTGFCGDADTRESVREKGGKTAQWDTNTRASMEQADMHRQVRYATQ